MSEETTIAAPKRMTAAKLAAQGGKKKGRGFWKDEATVAVLKRYAASEITIDEAAAELQTTPPAVTWAVRERGLSQSRAKQQAAKAPQTEAPLPHGSEPEGEEADVPF